MLEIALLKHHSDKIPVLAAMWYELLGRIWVPDVTIERVEARFHEHLNNNTLPITFVALENNKPVGMCSLRSTDGIRPDLTPWLGSLIVDKPAQGRGIAQLLVDAIKNKAKAMGHDTLYLLTFDPTLPDYYGSLGWKHIGMDSLLSHDVTVMSIDL
jgi:predicted N-acetyltransferase YhbS